MSSSRRTVVNPVIYDVQYIQPVRTEISHTYGASSLGSGKSFLCSRCGPCCCLLSILACLLIAAGLAVGIYFIVKNAKDGNPQENNTNVPSTSEPLTTHTTSTTTTITTTTDHTSNDVTATESTNATTM